MKTRITTLIVLLLTCIASVRAEDYDLWVGSTQVTSANKSNILGDGHFGYDSSANRLYVKGDLTAATNCITSKISNLEIYISYDATLKCTSSYKDAITINANTTITGPGKLTVVSNRDGIVVDRDISLTIKNADMDITGAEKGITGSSPYYGTQSITINNSNLQISSTLGAIYAFRGGIQINYCYIANPLGATYSGKNVVDKDGNTALNVTISNVDPPGSGTLEDPYSAKGAYEFAYQLSWTSTTVYETSSDVYVKGIISRIEINGCFSESGTFGNASFYIKDASGTTEFRCFRILYFNNKRYQQGSQAPDIKVGDEVIVYGKLMNHRGNTPQTVQEKAYLYSLNGNTSGYAISTGIYDVNHESITNSQYYSLDGIRIEGKPVKKGVYIVNGQKVVIK